MLGKRKIICEYRIEGLLTNAYAEKRKNKDVRIVDHEKINGIDCMNHISYRSLTFFSPSEKDC